MDTDRTLQVSGGRQGSAGCRARGVWPARRARVSHGRSREAGPYDRLWAVTYQSGDPAERAFWLDRTVESGAGIVRFAVAWAERRGASAATRPHKPRQRLLRLLFNRPGGARCRGAWPRGTADRQRAPAWAEGPGRPASAAPGTWKPNPSDLADFMPGGRRSLLGQLRSRWPRPGAAAPRRAGAADLGRAQPRLLAVAAIQGKTAVGPDHYREMLNASYQAVKAVNPQMLVVTGGTAPYGDPPGGPYSSIGARPARAVLAASSSACTRRRRTKKKKGKKKKEKRRLARKAREDAGLSRPGDVRRLRPPSDRQHRRGAAESGPIRTTLPRRTWVGSYACCARAESAGTACRAATRSG